MGQSGDGMYLYGNDDEGRPINIPRPQGKTFFFYWNVASAFTFLVNEKPLWVVFNQEETDFLELTNYEPAKENVWRGKWKIILVWSFNDMKHL